MCLRDRVIGFILRARTLSRKICIKHSIQVQADSTEWLDLNKIILYDNNTVIGPNVIQNNWHYDTVGFIRKLVTLNHYSFEPYIIREKVSFQIKRNRYA
jgi:hypothetical protein